MDVLDQKVQEAESKQDNEQLQALVHQNQQALEEDNARLKKQNEELNDKIAEACFYTWLFAGVN